MDINQAKKLLQRYREGIASPSEKQLVNQWYGQLVKSGEWQWDEGEKEKMEQVMEANLLRQINESEQTILAPVRHLFWSRVVVAASIIGAIGIGFYLLSSARQAKQNDIVKTEPAKDVKAPASNRAMITLANGLLVFLDSAMNGTLAMQGNAKLMKLGSGQIVYRMETGEAVNEIKYNTLENPRGSKVVNITLADGSRIWLNAGSSVTYPVAFAGNERKVSVKGEAYFEIAHDAAKPFYVSKGDIEVKVLGTHFNVNAYDDESDVKVTLLEGSVKLSNTGQTVIIKPGEQAVASSNSPLTVYHSPDLDKVMAWKNGLFNFEDAELKDIMRELSRWYDVEVVYEGNIPKVQFWGKIDRNTVLSSVLKGLEESGIHFRIEEGKRLIVIP